MAFETGHQKVGGRKKGTPNKLTKEMREMLKGVVADELNTLGQRIEELEPRDRLEVFIKLLLFVLPKTQSIAHSKGEGLEVEW
jgi:hypothetical protein